MAKDIAQRLAPLADRSTLSLTHYGRKSGKPYSVVIWFMVDGGTVYLATANVNRQWVRNVKARPEVILDIGGEHFTGKVEPLTSPKDRDKVNQLVQHKYWYTRPLFALASWFPGLTANSGAFRVRLR